MVQIITGNPHDYRVGNPKKPGLNDCVELSTVSHVTHAFRAPEILRSGSLSGRLVYDQSRLIKSRIHVVWLSPNYWAPGFRYGTVALKYDWTKVISNRQAFWIEVAKYKIPACRILLTDQPQPGLLPYDPTVRKGSWWHDTSTGKHYYNGGCCLEFMVEGDMSLEDVSETYFVKHHDDWCSEHRDSPQACDDLGRSALAGGARFIGRVVGCGIPPHPFKPKLSDLKAAYSTLYRTLVPRTPSGKLTAKEPTARAVASSALWFFGTERYSEAKNLMKLFASSKDADLALQNLVEKAFKLPAETLSDEDLP